MDAPERFEEAVTIERPAAQVLSHLADSRCLRAALPGERLTAPRHYGPPDGVGARLALGVEHVHIRRSGVLTLTSAPPRGELGPVRWRGEMPPVDYQLTFTAEPQGEDACALRLAVEATPQPLFFFRLRTKARVRRHLKGDLPQVWGGLAERLARHIGALPLDPAFRPRVSIDGFVEAGPRSAVPPGGAVRVMLLGKAIALFDVGGQLYAVADRCPHAGAPLSEGKVEGDVVICPRHGRRYDLKTGARDGDPGDSIPTWPVRDEGGQLWVRVGLV